MSSLTANTSQKITATLINILILSGLTPVSSNSASAQTTLACKDVRVDLLNLNNNAFVRYQVKERKPIALGVRNNAPPVTPDFYETVTNTANTTANPTSEANLPLRLVSLGIEDSEGNTITGLGAIALDLVDLYQQSGLDEETAQSISLLTIEEWSALSADTSSAQVVEIVKGEVARQIADRNIRRAFRELDETTLLTVLGGFGKVALKSLGLPNKELELISPTRIESASVGSFADQIQTANQTAIAQIDRPEIEALLTAARGRYQQELNNLRLGKQSPIATGSRVKFKFRLDNQQNRLAQINIPKATAIAKSGLSGAGKIVAVNYRLSDTDDADNVPRSDITESGELVSIPAQASLELDIEVEVLETSPTEVASVNLELQPDCGAPVAQSLNTLPLIGDNSNELIDPLGNITGCAGEILPDYQGFVVALFDPDPSDPTGSTEQGLTELTETELPDDRDNNIPKGIKPNTQNSNPFFLVNSDGGKYSFLFDSDRNQLDFGETYILVVTPPRDSIYDERRVKLEIGERQGNVVEYTATSLDGRPIRASDGQTTVTGEIVIVEDAERVGLDLAVLDLSSSICDAQEIQLTKTGDRVSAESGDIVLYRLTVRNLASAPIENLQITDTLPPGFKLETDSIRAEAEDTEVEVDLIQSDRTVEITAEDLTLEQDEVLNLVYAAQVTPNAVRGSGRNSAIVNATRTDNNLSVQDGPAIHTLQLEPGIIEDAGTLIGRVFVDKNFDGEQQPGEPGIPNAVIYLEDGNRIITDPDGLFSVTNVLPGMHTGILDLTTIPEYRLAPNVRFIESNSSSRLVRLEPGGMVRMNFGVTPTAGKKTQSPAQDSLTPEKPKIKDKPNIRSLNQ